MDLKRIFGQNVRRLRQAAGLSQEELAALIEVDQAYVSRMEAGQKNVTLSTIAMTARALKVTPSSLLQAA